MSKWITHSEWAAFNQIMLYWNITFFTFSNVITSAENLFCSHEHHKGLQNPWNIWPPAYITPIPKKGDPTFSVPEQASYCLGFGCSCVVFLPDGLSTSARETIFDRTAPKRPEGDPEFTVKKPDSWWESITCETDGGLQVCHSHRVSASKRGSGKIRCPHDCCYRDRALIYCKHSQTPGT